MTVLIARLLVDDDGQDLIEYALLATFISLAGIVGTTMLKNAVAGVFTLISGQLAE